MALTKLLDDAVKGFFTILLSVMIVVLRYKEERVERNRVHTSSLTGIGFMTELLADPGREVVDLLRMNYITFRRLCTLLQDQNLIRRSRYVSVEEQVAIFLLTVGHNIRNRVIQNRFQHSGSTISRYFHRVLCAICQLHAQYLTMPSVEVPDLIKYSSRFYPYFQNCLGAIDGCHVPIHVSRKAQIRYRNRKGFCSQNVMAVVGFDMRFQYVLAGYEGSGADATILQDALTRPHGRFSLPEGKYYLVDAGYANTRSFIAPFRGTRYHLNEYLGRNNPQNPQELFNHRHMSLRNVVERTFGVWKNRFPMLKIATCGYITTTQGQVVIATCILHNFILSQGGIGDDLAIDHDANVGVDFEDESPPEITPTSSTQYSQREESQFGATLRDSIMTQMWMNR